MSRESILNELVHTTPPAVQHEFMALCVHYFLAESSNDFTQVWERVRQLETQLPTHSSIPLLFAGMQWRIFHVKAVMEEAMDWAQQHVAAPAVVIQCFPQAWDVRLSDRAQHEYTLRIQREVVYPPGGRDVETVSHITVLEP